MKMYFWDWYWYKELLCFGFCFVWFDFNDRPTQVANTFLATKVISLANVVCWKGVRCIPRTWLWIQRWVFFWFCMLITALFYNWVPIKIWKCMLGSFWEVVLTTATFCFICVLPLEYNGHYHQYLLCSMVLTGVWNIGNVKNILPFHVHGKLNTFLNIQYNCWV